MRDILIRGVEMPDGVNGYTTIRIYGDGTVTNAFTGKQIGQVTWLPPHGRLIDAEAIEYVTSEDGCLNDYAYRYDINELPTIIPASE